MKHGDFTELAKYYNDRPGYSKEVLIMLKKYIESKFDFSLIIADIGAGTGKLTEDLCEIGSMGFAIEPNDEMRKEGIANFVNKPEFKWLKGSAESTGLENDSVEWILMGSSFHWVNVREAVNEFSRVLKKRGFFTAIWNTRVLDEGSINSIAEKIIQDEVPDMHRVSSGGKFSIDEMMEKMSSYGLFGNVIYTEAYHVEKMNKERYLNIWRSVNDIRVQAGEEKFVRILNAIADKIRGDEILEIKYKTRAWTAQVLK